MFLLTDLYFLTENVTGLEERRKIDAPYTDVNDLDDCEDPGDFCEKDPVYYFIYCEYICFLMQNNYLCDIFEKQ
jgi:hypothetical protein